MELPEDIRPVCDAYMVGLQAVLGDKLYGVYLNGAITFPETEYTGDIDFHVIFAGGLNDDEKSGVFSLHDEMGRNFPSPGCELDVHYILLNDTGKSEPHHQVVKGIKDTSWALHRAYMLAGRVLVLYGPDPGEIFLEPSWSELDSALQSELKYVKKHLDQYSHYCIMNLCRLVYSYETRDVVTSKTASGEWARDRFPEWSGLIDAAIRSYKGEATEKEKKEMQSEVSVFYQFAAGKIESCREIQT